jgi:glycosyltransferase involved in cell wall biosynthesis
MSGQNIVCFANDWDSDPTSKHQVMKILARSNRVLWVNSIGLRRPGATAHDASRIVAKVKKFWHGPVSITPHLHVLTPLAIPFHDVPGVPIANAWLLSRYIRHHVRRLGMERFQMWTFMPTTAPLVPYLKPDKLIYYCVDEWSAFTFLNSQLMEQMEHSLIRQSDVVIASAEKLYATKRHLNPETHLVSHGVDSEHFASVQAASTQVAVELRNVTRPVIGFWGLIGEWIDLELIRYVAERHPDWSVALIGKADVSCASLQDLPNVHLIGSRSYESLPGFAKGFTAAILPFKVNRLTENVNPIKLREYLAAGLPVVSTALPEVKQYDGVVRIGHNRDEFVAQLEAAVLDTSPSAVRKRMDAVSHESWEARVEHISRLIAESQSSIASRK